MAPAPVGTKGVLLPPLFLLWALSELQLSEVRAAKTSFASGTLKPVEGVSSWELSPPVLVAVFEGYPVWHDLPPGGSHPSCTQSHLGRPTSIQMPESLLHSEPLRVQVVSLLLFLRSVGVTGVCSGLRIPARGPEGYISCDLCCCPLASCSGCFCISL